MRRCPGSQRPGHSHRRTQCVRANSHIDTRGHRGIRPPSAQRRRPGLGCARRPDVSRDHVRSRSRWCEPAQSMKPSPNPDQQGRPRKGSRDLASEPGVAGRLRVRFHRSPRLGRTFEHPMLPCRRSPLSPWSSLSGLRSSLFTHSGLPSTGTSSMISRCRTMSRSLRQTRIGSRYYGRYYSLVPPPG